jgi:hypothetical protein
MNPSNDPDWELARNYLVHLQAKAAATAPFPHREKEDPTANPQVIAHLRKVYASMSPKGDEAGFQALLATYREQAAAARAACPSPYESPDWYAVVSAQFEALSRSADEMNMKLAHPPLLGTLATGRVNGVAIALEGVSTRIILLEQGLFGFANLMCKAVAASLVYQGEAEDGKLSFSIDEEAIRDKLARDDEPIRRFFDALCSYVILGAPHRAEPYAAPPFAVRVSEILRESMELFIVGHEFAHVALGHLDGRRVLHAIATDVDAETVQTNWEQEFEADAIGMLLMVRAMIREHKFDLALSYWGAHLFFGCIDIVERTVSLLATGEQATWRGTSHPQTQDRQRMLQAALAQFVKSEEAVKGAIRLAGQVDEILSIFWRRCEGPLREMHAKGTRPTEEWMAHSDS